MRSSLRREGREPDDSLDPVHDGRAELPVTALIVEIMTEKDLPEVHEIESLVFPQPWSMDAFRQEIRSVLGRYLVVRLDERVVGYVGIMLVEDEGHITTLAVHPDYQRQGIGTRMLEEVINMALRARVTYITLEVRVSNNAARRLYQRYGFRDVGVRKGYYTDTGEDALVMVSPDLDGPEFRRHFARKRLARRDEDDPDESEARLPNPYYKEET